MQTKAYWSLLTEDEDIPGHEFHTALIKVANGIEKNTPQNPNMLPKINTARMITIGWSFTASEKINGTNKFPSINWSNKYKPISK